MGEPQSKDWGRIAIIKGPAHAGSDSAPCIYVLSVIPANDTKKQFKTMPLAKAAKDVVLPLLLQQLGVTAEAKTDKASFQDINGIQFARLGFSVQSGETNTAQTRGFISVAKENNKFVAFCGCDVVPFVTETMDPMEAAVSTVTE